MVGFQIPTVNREWTCFLFFCRSLKRHIESSHAGQKFEGMDYVYPYREKGRPRSKSHLHSKYIDSSEIVYETEEQMDSYELDEEQVSI